MKFPVKNKDINRDTKDVIDKVIDRKRDLKWKVAIQENLAHQAGH